MSILLFFIGYFFGTLATIIFMAYCLAIAKIKELEDEGLPYDEIRKGQ